MKNLKLHKNDLPDDFTMEGDIAIDTEAMGLQFHRDRLCTVQFCGPDRMTHIVQFTSKEYNAPNLINLLSDKDKVKIFHYGRFDLAIIEYYLGIKLENIFCTKIASKLARTYTDNHGLKDLCKELIGISLSKQQQSSNWGAEDLSKDQLEYAAKDVIYLHQIREEITKMLVKEERLELAKELFAFLPTRAHLDIIGWNDKDIFSHGS